MVFRALIIDDEETYARALGRVLGRRGIETDWAASCAAGLERLRQRPCDIVLLDYLLPDGSGLDLIRPIRALPAAPQVLMMTAFGTIENAVEAMRRGAVDYLTKSTALEGVVERVLDAKQLAELQAAQPTSLAKGKPANELLGESSNIVEARARILEVAQSPDTTVLLSGESGTGKGVVARMIHGLSARAKEPYVAIDCVALPAALAESELFGHEKGAFTSADRAKQGKFEAVGTGTVLLDEVGDMELGLQGKLLRVLEERAFERVGGLRPISFKARVVAASHRDLAHCVEEGRFRLDLYHRLSVFPILIPPLRQRGDDVVVLAEHFLRDFGARLGKPALSIGKETLAVLRNYEFPGNVRELKNVIERATILAHPEQRELVPTLLPSRLVEAPARVVAVHHAPSSSSASSQGGPTVEFRPGADTLGDVEWRMVEEALRAAGGNKGRAAEMLGISRFALMRRLAKRQAAARADDSGK